MWNFVFKVDYAHTVTSKSMPIFPGTSLALLFHLVRVSDGFALCDSEYVPFEGWADGLERGKPTEGEEEAQGQGKKTKDEQRQELWKRLKEDLLVGWDFEVEDAGHKGHTGSSGDPKAKEVGTAELDEEDDEVVFRLFKALDRMKEACDMEGRPVSKNFWCI